MGTVAGSGFSRANDALRAGRSVAHEALERLDGEMPDVLFVFTTDRYNQQDLLRSIRQVAGDVPLIGCCTGGVIGPDGTSSDGVSLLALGGGVSALLTSAQGVRSAGAQAGAQASRPIAAELNPAEERNSAVVMLADGLTGTLTEVVAGTAAVLGARFPLVGGGAGDNLKFLRTSQLVGDQVLEDAVALGLLRSSGPIGVGVRHGWTPVSQPLRVTYSAGNLLYELDGRPAFEAYRELFPEARLTEENFSAFVMGHPIGMPQPSGEFLIRDPLRVRPNGALECVAAVPEGVNAQIMCGDQASLFMAAQAAARAAVDQLDGHKPTGVLIFDCVSRLLMLGSEASTEVSLIRDVVGRDTPVAGMFSFGEIAAGADCRPVLHNKTVVVCAFG